jgi:hypothetical protein
MGRAWVGEDGESGEYFQARSCGSKRRYVDRAEANRGRYAMSESNLRIYHCKFCGGWHIGHHGDKVAKQYHKVGKMKQRERRRGR